MNQHEQSSFDDFQFYPTPRRLATQAWGMFESRDIDRLLEPSAGRGDLIAPKTAGMRHRELERFKWDAIEIDATNHPLLIERGARVVGYDFLQFQGVGRYSHVLMNPPFAQGAKHLLHAWNQLFDGEIVAIVNAETLRNQCSAERLLLARVVAEHGHVEFVADAFHGEDVFRQAQVEVALIHLVKRASGSDIVGDMIEGLTRDEGAGDGGTWSAPNELSIPAGLVEETVRNFDMAVAASKESSIASARAAHYRTRLGKTMADLQGRDSNEASAAFNLGASVRNSFSTCYDELKDAAWTQILRSTQVLSRLSHNARKRVEREFESIKALEFTVSNIYGFLYGLAQKGGEIQMGMVCDVFDSITRYHSDNTVYYMGWKSNDLHRTAGMRIKRSRFILPGEPYASYRSGAGFQILSMLGDFDRVFAMLDGKQHPAVGLRDLFAGEQTYKRLAEGERLSSDYFDVRFYRGIGTIHFYPRSVEVIERLNRVVGRYRNWLPPSMDDVGADYQAHYDRAEKLHADFQKTYATQPSDGHSRYWRMSTAGLTSDSAEVREETNERVCRALAAVCEAHDLHPFEGITHEAAPKLMLAA